MKKLTRFLSSKLIKDSENINDRNVRYRYGMLEGWMSIFGNLIIFAIKLFWGVKVKSVALITDAVHTLSDSLSSGVVIYGFYAARKPSDKEHPFGHGKMEPIAALVIAVLLFVAGFEFLQFSIHKILHPTVFHVSQKVIWIVAGTMVLKELMARFAYALGEIAESDVLKADAFHHRTDAVSTLLVIVALIAPRFGYYNVDGIMGVFVSLVIFYSAFVIARDAMTPLLGEAPSKELLESIERIASGKKGVLGVHDIICHNYGRERVASFHIEVSDQDSPSNLHRISEEIEMEIGNKLGCVVVVHIDPVNKDHHQYEEVEVYLKKMVSEDDRLHSFHELRIIEKASKRDRLIFDIVLEDEVNEEENDNIVASMKEKLVKKFPEMKVIIKTDPKYIYNL